MVKYHRFIVYGGIGNHAFDQAVLDIVNNTIGLNLQFSNISYQRFPDGELAFSLEEYEKIAGRHVILFSCPISDKLENELEDMILASKQQYRAKSVTVVLTFLRNRRQDHEEKHEEITRLRWFIFKLKKIGADRLIVTEPHSIKNTKKFCENCGIKLHICNPSFLFAEAIKSTVVSLGVDNVKFYSPDFGSVGRAMGMAKILGTGIIATPKDRLFGDQIAVNKDFNEEEFLSKIKEEFGEEVSISCDPRKVFGKHIFIREDEISTGGTSITIARMLRKYGAESLHFIATTSVCAPGWKMKLLPNNGQHPFDSIWFGNIRPRGDGVSSYEESTGGKVHKVDLAPAVAKALSEVMKEITKEENRKT